MDPQTSSFVYKLTTSYNLCNEVFLGDELLENATFSGTVNTTFHFHTTHHPRKPHYIQSP